MLFKEQFISQWKDFISIVDSSIIRQIKENKPVSVDEINQVIAYEKSNWLSASKYQGIWLNKVKSVDAEIGMRFEKIIKELKLSDVKAVPSPSFIPYGLIALGIGVITYFTTSYFKLESWKVIGATIFMPLFIGGTLYAIWKDKKITNRMENRSIYINQLDKEKEQLAALCEILDKRK